MPTSPVPTIPALEPVKVVALLLQDQLGLKDGQIMLSYENWEVPENPGLYVALSYGVETVIGNNNFNSVDDEGNYVEVQACTMMHQVVVDLMSFDSSARQQKEAFLWAFASEYAQSLMNKYSMRLATTPGSFTTVTAPEPSKQLNRFQITVEIYALHQNAVTAAYFTELQTVQLVENP